LQLFFSDLQGKGERRGEEKPYWVLGDAVEVESLEVEV